MVEGRLPDTIVEVVLERTTDIDNNILDLPLGKALRDEQSTEPVDVVSSLGPQLRQVRLQVDSIAEEVFALCKKSAISDYYGEQL